MEIGPLEAAIIFAFFAIPFVVLYLYARAKRQSKLYVLWGFFGFIGLIVGLAMMEVMPRRKSA